MILLPLISNSWYSVKVLEIAKYADIALMKAIEFS